jgi:TPR repeat protein
MRLRIKEQRKLVKKDFAAMAVAVGLLLSATVHADPIDEARKLLGTDRAKAYAILKPLADQGDPEAQAVLAGMYNAEAIPGQKPGEAVEKAFFWMTKAAESGDAQYQSLLGTWLFMGGFGLWDADPVRAIPWLEKAAAQDDAVAEYLLGRAFKEGLGVPKNPAEAVGWFQRAAKHGHDGAEEALAGLLATGRGLPQDDRQAFELYLKQARKGSATAALSVAGFYSAGRGVKEDRIEAYAWYTTFAALSDDAVKVQLRDAAAGKLTFGEINEGQRRALELFRPNDRMHVLEQAEQDAESRNIVRRAGAAELFLDGTLVPQNFPKAFGIFQKLADQGYAPGLLGLARMYAEGLGMEPDLVEAYKLYYIARDRPSLEGDEDKAEKGLARLALKMSEDLMDYARKRALKWQPTVPRDPL